MTAKPDQLFTKAEKLLKQLKPVSFHYAAKHDARLNDVLNQLKARLPKHQRNLIPSVKSVQRLQLLGVQEFNKQLEKMLDHLRTAKELSLESPLPLKVQSILGIHELETIEETLDQATRSLARSDWKSAIVMAGSALEAVLHTRISLEPDRFTRAFQDKWPSRKPPSAPHEYRPADALAVIVGAGCLPTALAKYAEGLQQSRNIVHPAVEDGQKLQPSQLEAELAVNTVYMVILRLLA